MSSELNVFIMSTGVPEDIEVTIDSFLSNTLYDGTINIITPPTTNNTVKYKNVNLITLDKYPTRQNYFKCIVKNLTAKYVMIMSDGLKFIKKYSCIDKIVNYLNNNDTCGLFLLNKVNFTCKKDTSNNINLYENYSVDYNEFITLNEKKDKFACGSLWPFCLSKPSVFRSDFLKELDFPYVNRFFEYHIVNTLVNRKFNIVSLDTVMYNFIYLPDEHLFQINVVGDRGPLTKELDTVRLEYRKHAVIDYKNINILNIFDAIKDNKFHYRKDVMANIFTHKRIWEDNRVCIVLDNSTVPQGNLMESLKEAIFMITNNSNTNTQFDLIQLSESSISSGYIISKNGLDKIKNFYKFNKMKYSVDDSFLKCPDFKIHKLNPPAVRIKEIMDHKIITDLEGYQFYSKLDSRGYDIKYAGKLSAQELKIVADSDPNCAGFNTLGWLKGRTKPVNEMINITWSNEITEGLYVKDFEQTIQNKIKLLVENKNNQTTKSDLTFTVTTCKRWDYFKETIDTLLIKCKNIEVIDKWLCVDDNSSKEDREKMKERYPFFDFIFKEEVDKGHVKSMNMIWDNVTTTYILHFEDDWLCNNCFNLKCYLDYIKKSNIAQLILRRISSDDHIGVDHVDGNQIFKYVYNPNHSFKPELNKKYDEINSGSKSLYQTDKFWWWPGFSLNPSILNIKLLKKQVGYFNTEVRSELFEYDYALRCYNNNLDIHYVNLNIQHTGTVSSYSLNNLRRYYDK